MRGEGKLDKYQPIIREKPKNPRKSQQTKLILFILLGITVLITVPIYLFLPQNQTYKLYDYTYSTVKTRTFREYITVAGQINARKVVNLTAPFKGRLEEIYVKTGDLVAEGDLLFRLVSDDLDKELVEVTENLAKATNDLERSKLDLMIETQRFAKDARERNNQINQLESTLKEKEALFELGALSKKELNNAIEAFESAKLDQSIKQLTSEKTLLAAKMSLTNSEKQYRLAQEKLAEINLLISNKEIKSPIAGKILETTDLKDSEVNTSNILAKIATINNPYVQIFIPTTESEKIINGLPVTIKTTTSNYKGYVDKVALNIQNHTTLGPTVVGTVLFKENPEFIIPGTECKVEIELGSRDSVLYLPRGPYISTGSSMNAYTIKDNKANKTPVRLGVFDGSDVEIIEGLEAGDVVITSSYEDFIEFYQIEIDPRGGRKND